MASKKTTRKAGASRETLTEQVIFRVTPSQRTWLDTRAKALGVEGYGAVLRTIIDQARLTPFKGRAAS